MMAMRLTFLRTSSVPLSSLCSSATELEGAQSEVITVILMLGERIASQSEVISMVIRAIVSGL